MERCYDESYLDLFKISSRILVAGSSGSGKSELVKKIVVKYSQYFYKILIIGTSYHPIQEESSLSKKVVVSKEIIDPSDQIDDYGEGGLLVIYDDVFISATSDSTVVDVFTKGRHQKISAIFITQNLFMPGKFSRSISLNCTHFVLLKQRDLGQIETLGRQLFGRDCAKDVITIYKRCISEPYGYLLIDLGISTPELLRFRSYIVNEKEWEVVYIP